MSEYKVESVLPDPPKEWKGPHGVVYYKEVMLVGHDKPVSIGKKEPDALSAGDTVWGDIIPTDYLADKFKPSAPPAQTGSVGGLIKQDGNQYLKDLSDVPVRIYAASIGYFDTQGLVKDPNYYHSFVTYIQNITNDLLDMSENIRKAEAKVVGKSETSSEPVGTETVKPTVEHARNTVGNPALRKGLAKTGHSFGVADMEGEPYEGDPNDIPKDWD